MSKSQTVFIVLPLRNMFRINALGASATYVKGGGESDLQKF